MKRFLATTFFMAGASLAPVLALYAQQPPLPRWRGRPQAKTAEKAATTTSSDPVERIKRRRGITTVAGDGDRRATLTDVIGPGSQVHRT